MKGAHAQARQADAADPLEVRFGEQIDIRRVAPGGWLRLLVEEESVAFLLHRSDAQIAGVRAIQAASLIDPAKDEERAPDAPWLVVSGVCTHAGCNLSAGLGRYGGWACFCPGSEFDASGRVRVGPARRNLAVIPHRRIGSEAIVLVSSPG